MAASDRVGQYLPESKTRMKYSNAAKYLGGAVLAVMLAAMVTNPNQAAYDEYATETLAEYLDQEFCVGVKGMPDMLASLLSNGCKFLVESKQPEIKQYLSNHTRHQNLIFLSLYTTELLTYRFKVIGIFDKFFIYEATER